MEPTFQIESGAFFLLAMGILVLPLDWLFAALLAAAVHELSHYLIARLLGARCLSFRIGMGGAVMEFTEMGRWEELLAAAAGPAGSFLLLVFVSYYPQLAVCGLVQGAFNLLPVWPLDGGRIAVCLLGEWAKILKWGTLLLLLGLGICAGWLFGISPFLMITILAIKAFLRKIPCKAAIIGVQ